MNKSQKKQLGRILGALILFIAALVFNHSVKPVWWLGLLIMAIPYLLIGYDVLYKALRRIVRGEVFDESLLMTVASLGALVLCLVEKNADEAHEAAAIMIFYQVGELFQSIAVGKSRNSVSALLDMMPEFANVEENGELKQVAPEEVQVGQIITVRPGDRIPLDGVIVEGRSELNTASLTGESLPQEVHTGDGILSGCINISGMLKVKVTKPFSEGTVSKILELVENAGIRKSKSENFISSFARVYTPLVTGVALLVALIPSVITGIHSGVWNFSETWFPYVHAALMFLIVSCPCALVISVPMSFFGGIGGACSKGILIKGSVFVEALSKCKTAVFDKTGTLTEGNFKVQRICPRGIREEKLLQVAASAELYSTHPLGLAVKEACKAPLLPVEDYKEFAGMGVGGTIEGQNILVGNAKLMVTAGITPEAPSEAGSALYVSIDGAYSGYILLADALKEDSAAALGALKKMDICTVMLTGDRKENAERTAKELSLDRFYSELLPEEKLQIAEELMAKKDKNSTLCFVGDGINDAPVLAGADVGIAMGALGSDAAVEAADVVLMNDRPSDVCKAIGICRKTMRIVKENIVFALAVKFGVMLLIGLTAVLPGLNILESYAGELAVFADVGVSVVAILNATRALKS